jgi:hypothetical protein
MTRRSNAWHRQRIARAVLVCAKGLLIAAVILLLMGYFGSHVRDAAGVGVVDVNERGRLPKSFRRLWNVGSLRRRPILPDEILGIPKRPPFGWPSDGTLAHVAERRESFAHIGRREFVPGVRQF